MKKRRQKDTHTGLSIDVRGKRFFLINKRGGYQELDITPLYYFFEEFFTSDWRKEWAKMKCKHNPEATCSKCYKP